MYVDHAHSSGHFAASPQGKMRLVPWANKGSSKDNVMAEVNRKMQRALEEALMKNIHLQKVHCYCKYDHCVTD